MIADFLRFKRIERYNHLVQKTEETLHARGIDWQGDPMNTVPEKVVLPIIENATLEDDDDLHSLWANLLANALDPKFEKSINRRHTSILRELEPVDVQILNLLYLNRSEYFSDEGLSRFVYRKYEIQQQAGLDQDVIELSLLNLMRLGCIKPGVVKKKDLHSPISSLTLGVGSGFGFESFDDTVYVGTTMVHLSELGVSLCHAVSEGAPTDS